MRNLAERTTHTKIMHEASPELAPLQQAMHRLDARFASDWSNQELADLYRAHALAQAAQPGLECDASK